MFLLVILFSRLRHAQLASLFLVWEPLHTFGHPHGPSLNISQLCLILLYMRGQELQTVLNLQGKNGLI